MVVVGGLTWWFEGGVVESRVDLGRFSGVLVWVLSWGVEGEEVGEAGDAGVFAGRGRHGCWWSRGERMKASARSAER